MALILVTDNRYFGDSPGGSSRLAYDLAHAFATEGHRVYFLCQGVAKSSPERELDGQVAVLRYKPFAGTAHRWPLRHAQHAAAAQAVLERYLPEPPDIV